MPSLRDLLLRAVRTDALARVEDGVWTTRCLHCRSRVAVSGEGVALGSASLEHIVPRSWFERPGAKELVRQVGSVEDARNLAVACARCNQQKGRSHDARGPRDPRARQVIERLIARRRERVRE